MLEYRQGDLLGADTEALVNTVNCVGVMGRGVALQFKQRYPENFKAYASACARGEVQPGRMFVFETGELCNPRYIINFPTKRHWRGNSRMADIENGLAALKEEILHRGIASVALPPLGCGLGGLSWPQVRRSIATVLGDLLETRVVVFEPGGASEHARSNRSSVVPRMTVGRAALLTLMDRYLRGLLDPFVTLLEVHKLMYFLQEARQPLRLRFVKGPFGPYAENLRHVLHEIEGRFVSGYLDGGDAPDKRLELVPGALDSAESYLSGHPEVLRRLERVSTLVSGFETPVGLELLSTVHWLINREDFQTADALQESVYAWSERKRQFTSRQISIAVDRLLALGWVGKDVAFR